jgi:hypothetical protein
MDVVLGATLHDPIGRLAEAIDRLRTPIREIFPAIALNLSDATTPEVINAVQSLADKVMVHKAGEAVIGKARRDAVNLAADGRTVLYSDFDHMLRWVEHGAEDLRRAIAVSPDVDCLVIGRTARAFAAEPRRLRETETLVNHTHALLTGNHWDLMFAIRRLSPAAAQIIVKQSRVDTLANDVEWPLLVRSAGLKVDYTQSDTLFYRTIEEFGDDEDSGDQDALQWIRRLEFAAMHASAMRPFLKERG